MSRRRPSLSSDRRRTERIAEKSKDPRNIYIEGIGPVLLERSLRARRVSVSVNPSRGVRVAVPRRVSFREALEFVNLKQAWIRKYQARIARMERQRRVVVSSDIADRAAARRMLVRRLEQLAARYRFTYNRVTVRNQRTRWGSCSRQQNISLNIKIALLPEELQEYVLLHELVHTRVPNHSPLFWAELDRYVGNGKAIAKKLGAYSIGI